MLKFNEVVMLRKVRVRFSFSVADDKLSFP